MARVARLRAVYGAAAEMRSASLIDDLDGAETALERLRGQSRADSGSTWAPIDLAAVRARGMLTQPPTILARTDGQPLIYAGKVHAFNASSESGKSWLALAACAEQLALGHHVGYIDFEDGAEGILERIDLLGHDAVRDDHFHYARPDDPLDGAARAQLDAVLALHPALVVIDGVTEVMALHGWSTKDNDDVAAFLAALPRRIARTGAAVVMIDHMPKASDRQGDDHGIGAQHKRAGVDGATYRLDPLMPFGRGLHGISRIVVTKDRPGHVRPHCAGGKTVGELHLAPMGDALSLTILPPETIANPDKAFRPTVLMERIWNEVQSLNTTGQNPTLTTILTLVKGDRNAKQTAVKTLVAEGFLTVETGARGSLRHHIAAPYRQTGDPLSDRFEPDPEPTLEYDGEPF